MPGSLSRRLPFFPIMSCEHPSLPLGLLGDPNMTALGFSIPESLSRQLWATFPGALKHVARTLRKHAGSEGLLSLHPCGVRAQTRGARRMQAVEARARSGGTMLPAAETKTFRKVQPNFKFGFLFMCMYLESCFLPEPSPWTLGQSPFATCLFFLPSPPEGAWTTPNCSLELKARTCTQILPVLTSSITHISLCPAVRP